MILGFEAPNTSCNLPRASFKRHRTSSSRPELSGLSSRGPRRPRARRPAGLKTGPRRFLAAQNPLKINEKSIYFSSRTLPQPPATFPELSGTATELPGAAQKLSGGPSSRAAPARAESGWPQNWSPAISGSITITSFCSSLDLELPKLPVTFL